MAYTQLYYPPTSNGLQKTLGAQLDQADTTSMTLNNVTGIQDKPGVVVIDRIDTNSSELSAAVREYVSYTGVSGSTLTGLTRGLGGTSDQDHAVGNVVEFVFDITSMQAIIDFLLVNHNETTGHLQSGSQIDDTTKDHQYILGVSELTADRTVTLPLLTGNDDFVFEDHAQTMTNKRVTKRVTTITSNATPTVNTDNCDAVTITALATAITSMTTNLSGTPTNFQSLIYRILDDGTGRAITWGAKFQPMGATLPTTTTAGKVLSVGFLYDTVDAKWGCVAVSEEA